MVAQEVDAYPSRTGPEPTLIERRDPVVHPGRDGPLTHDQLQSFASEGFLSLNDLLSASELDVLRGEVQRMTSAPDLAKAPQTVIEPESREIRSVFEVHRSSRVFRDLAADSRIVDRVRQILGSDVYIHQSRMNRKSGFEGAAFYWHSDFETWHVEDGMPRMRAVSCSIALTDNYTWNGPLMVMPKSHLWFASCAGETPEEHYKHSLRKQEYGVPSNETLYRLAEEGGIVDFPVAAGSVVLFDCNIQHGSNSNISPLPRSNVFFVYNSLENTLVEPFCGLAPRPEFIASRKFTPVQELPTPATR